MILYRSSPKRQEPDYSYRYTASVDGVLTKTSGYMYFYNNETIANGDIVMGNNVTQACQMLMYCSNFNGNVTVSANTNNCYEMVYRCPNFGKNIYIKGTSSTRDTFNAWLIVDYQTPDKRKNIWIHSSIESYLRSAYPSSVLTWTDMSDGNGFYNATKNIYVYNNYSG